MKRLVIRVLAGSLLTFSYLPAAEAASFLEINVGGTIVSCNNTAALCGAGFTTAIGSNTIQFTGVVNGVSFGNAAAGTVGVQLTGNQPGDPIDGATSTDTKTTVSNTTAGPLAVTVSFASNGFSIPGNLMSLSGTANIGTVGAVSSTSESFQASGDAANTLIPGAGVDTSCVAGPVASPPQTSAACNAPIIPFNGGALFALSGIQQFTLQAGNTINASGSVQAFANPIPEPASMLLLGTGLLGLAARARRKVRGR